MFKIESLDKELSIEKNKIWIQTVKKKSLYEAKTSFEILDITWKFLWSWYWLRNKINSMDSRKIDFINETMKHNKRTSEIKNDFTWREIAEYSFYWEKFII